MPFSEQFHHVVFGLWWRWWWGWRAWAPFSLPAVALIWNLQVRHSKSP